jgi:SAM-dependent methyltransferase
MRGCPRQLQLTAKPLERKKMVELTSREHMLAMVADNPDWSVLDLGCGADGIQLANTYADYEDRTQSYPNNRFVKTDACNTPFEDKEFDFVFAIHLLEHIPNPSDICSELMRIGKRGFIEVPTPFFDNFVLGNSWEPPHGHVKWVTFDNVKKEIVFKPRYQIVAESAVPADTTFLLPFFRDSMHVEIYWENTIDFRIDEPIFSWTSGNSDAPHVVDLRGKKIPSNAKPWQPRRLWK